MDTQDLQDGRRFVMQFGEITEKSSVVHSMSSMSESIIKLKSSCTSCPSMFIHFA